jgi:hypothetical protein
MKPNLRQLEDFQDKIWSIPEEEWYAAARVVVEQKRKETGIANWAPSLLMAATNSKTIAYSGRRKTMGSKF